MEQNDTRCAHPIVLSLKPLIFSVLWRVSASILFVPNVISFGHESHAYAFFLYWTVDTFFWAYCIIIELIKMSSLDYERKKYTTESQKHRVLYCFLCDSLILCGILLEVLTISQNYSIFVSCVLSYPVIMLI